MSQTIAAVSTGNVISAIGIIRMTGDDCIAVADKVFTLNNKKSLSTAPDRKLMLGQLHDKQGRAIDSCCIIISTPGKISCKILSGFSVRGLSDVTTQ